MPIPLPLSYACNIDTAGVAEQLVPPDAPYCMFTVQAFDDNTDPVVVGTHPKLDLDRWGSDVYAGATATAGAQQGLLLKPGQERVFIGKPCAFWVNARTNGDGVGILMEALAAPARGNSGACS